MGCRASASNSRAVGFQLTTTRKMSAHDPIMATQAMTQARAAVVQLTGSQKIWKTSFAAETQLTALQNNYVGQNDAGSFDS